MDIHPSIAVKDRSSGQSNTYKMEQEAIFIGRDRANFIVLNSKRVSRQHAEIRFEEGNFFIVDLGSGNGTYLNSQRLAPKEKMLLRNSDKIHIEDFDLLFSSNTSAVQPDFGDITDTDVLEFKMLKKLLRAVDKENAPVLEVVGGDHSGKRFILEGKTQEAAIGRDPACEFHIDSEVISRKHARIIKKWDTVTLIDLASKNGVYINDTRIREQVLNDGDRILLGTLPLVFRNPSEQGLDFLASEPPVSSAQSHPAEESDKSFIPEEPSQIGRVARKSSTAGTEEMAAETNEPNSTPQEISDAPADEPSEHSASLPAAAAPDEAANLPVWKRFSPMEIGAALAGLIILFGSIWLLLKVL